MAEVSFQKLLETNGGSFVPEDTGNKWREFRPGSYWWNISGSFAPEVPEKYLADSCQNDDGPTMSSDDDDGG